MAFSCDDYGVCDDGFGLGDLAPDDTGIFDPTNCDDNGNCDPGWLGGSGSDCPLGSMDDNGQCGDYVGTAGSGVKVKSGGGWASVGNFLGKLFGGVAGQVGGVRSGAQGSRKSCRGFDASGQAVTVSVPLKSACPTGTSLYQQRATTGGGGNNNMLLLGLAGITILILVTRK